LFQKFDVNNNGFLNIHDVMLGVRKVIFLSPDFINNQVITSAFEAATDKIYNDNDSPLKQNKKKLLSKHIRILLS